MALRALITGVTGQDGSYLSEHLLSAGWQVSGVVRRNSTPEYQTGRLEHILPQLDLHYGDVTDADSISRIVEAVRPDAVFNLAAQSHVRISSDVPQFTAQVNAIGVLNVLEAVRRFAPHARVYQASSSEMFGSSVDADGYQRETTPMHPVSPYGVAKLYGYHICRHYRTAYGMFVSNGILFNHSSPRRGSNFVEAKVVKTAVRIAAGLETELVLGNMDSQRDWGHSADYTRAMLRMLCDSRPDDFVIATGETHSVRDLVAHVFSKVGLNYLDYVRQDERYLRPQELPFLRGDASKARRVLGWTPTVSFTGLLNEMIEHAKEKYAH